VGASCDADEAVAEELPAADALCLVAGSPGHENKVELAHRKLRRGVLARHENTQLHTGSLAHQPGHDAGQEDQLRVVTGADEGSNARRLRIERPRRRQGPRDLVECPAQGRPHSLGPDGWHHAVTATHEQLIARELPQTRKGMACRALTDPDPRGRSRHAPLSQQGVEGHEEVEIEGPKMNLIHGGNVRHPLDRCAPRTQIRLRYGGRTTPRS
jgi:hypothetical protein